jgi:UDPglucose 6-dehydrogenase/UDP-N-acetyl-D-galactosamine dehydrogenase
MSKSINNLSGYSNLYSKNNLAKKTVCIVGLGYVGLPLAEVFSKYFNVIGYDTNQKKVKDLKNKYNNIEITTKQERIKIADYIIIAVPTPITNSKEPDLSFVTSASRIVGKNLKKGAIIVLESTVYPGVTEEVVGPILEKESGLKLGIDFKIGYSPERINPGDKIHTIDKIIKIVSGMDKESTDKLAELYGKVTTVYIAKDIKTAEAAKVIENIQRDLNIGLINELSIIFNKMGLNTKAILEAAYTKWNFNRYEPGLVGGHCIPVDPYYLVYKAKELGYHPQIILAGRSVNDYMSKHVVDIVIRTLNENCKVINGSKILIMGLTFKENVADTRQSPVKEIIKNLKEFRCEIFGYDPLLTNEQIKDFDLKALDNLYGGPKFDCVIITVVHDEFKKIRFDKLIKIFYDKPVIIDVRGMFKHDIVKNGIIYRTL